MTYNEKKIIIPLLLAIMAAAFSWLDSIYLLSPNFLDGKSSAWPLILLTMIILLPSTIMHWRGSRFFSKVFTVTMAILATLLWLALLIPYFFTLYNQAIIIINDLALVHMRSKINAILLWAYWNIDSGFMFDLLAAALVSIAALVNKRTKIKGI
ncbi:MAG: hypothetical protein WC508_04150 [Patescibacteria group bacterium]